MKKKGILATAILIALSLLIIFGAFALIMKSVTVDNNGQVKSIGIEVYEDELLIIPLKSIDWGMIEPNETKTFNFWAYNDGNSPVTLTMIVDNWIPVNASNYLSLTWSYKGETIGEKQKLGLTFNLSANQNITGIDTFSFTTTISASG